MMLLAVLTSVLATIWVLYCLGLFLYHYIVEVVYDLPEQGQTPCTAHSALKKLIERLIEESLTLPLLRKAQEHPTDPVDETDRTYEDLLATAIINKVITKAQNRLPNSSAASVSSRISNSSRRGDKEYFFGEETLDSKWKTTDFETTSFSSVEDWVHSDSSGVGSKKYVDRETLTIIHDIEISASDSEEEDDTEYFRSRSSLLGDDEPNWFLQKRHFQTASPVPVPMLVPKPTAEAKVLIGDKEVDETSDLSDIASDYGDTEIVPRSQSILLESKTIIGGKNPLHNGSDGESSADSGVKEVDRDRSGYDQPDFVTKADITVDDDNVEDASILSVYSNTEKEAEYTERYASLPRTIVKTPTPSSRPSLSKDKLKGIPNLESSFDKPKNEKNNSVIEDISYEIYENTDERNEIEDDDSVFEGSYSKKEKEKWKHAVQMKNNPYSKENIEKRINRTRSPFDTLFGPDYYARQASSPSGGKLKNMEDIEWANQKNNNADSWVTVQNVSSEVAVEEPGLQEKPITQNIIPKIESNQDLSISEITSDSDLSYINYYDVENSQVYKKSSETTKNEVNNNEEVILKEILNISPEQNKSQFTKVTSGSTSRYTKNTNLVKKRHKSESDLLLEDSFNEPPKVLARKKDNTLISKIYSQLHSRNFAVSGTKEVPAELRTQTSNNSRYNGNVALYNSEGEMSYDKKSLYSSSEELLEPAVKPQTFFRSTSAINYNRSNRKSSISSDEDALSEHSLGSSKKKHIYSSSDDLFSIEEKEIPQKKKDNTLIDKIYQNLHVRNYALLNRDNIPIKVNAPTPFKNAYSSEDEIIKNEITSSVPEASKRKKGSYSNNYDLHLASEIDFGDSSDERSIRSVTTPDPEIDEIAKKKIVHNLLDKFATLAPEVMPRRKFVNTDQQELIDSESEMSISVKELRKKFENKNVRSEVNSSLTARSISKKVRDELKH